MRSVTVTIRDKATGIEAEFNVGVDLPRGALLFDVQKRAVERVREKFFTDQRRQHMLAARRRGIRTVEGETDDGAEQLGHDGGKRQG
jgi:hypothetical protein